MSSFQIYEARGKQKWIKNVLLLADKYRKLLGFIPRKAIQADIENGKVLVAIQNDNVIGYVLFRLVTKREAVAITHLCVHDTARHKGVAHALVRALSKQYQYLRGITALCRTDYDANRVWPKIGFVARNEVPGRSKQGSQLTRWWRDHGHPDLFTLSAPDHARKTHVIIDANVFYDLCDDQDFSRESSGLIADWLVDDLELLWAPELQNEISRSSDSEKKRLRRAALSRFARLVIPVERFECVLDQLQSNLPPAKNHQDESDYRQLAWAIAGESDALITRDQTLLNLNPNELTGFDIEILRPVDLIVRFDQLRGSNSYSPQRLAGTTVANSAAPDDITTRSIQPLLSTHQREKGSAFVQKVRELMANPTNCDVRAIYGKDRQMIGLLGRRHLGSVIDVPLLRTAAGAFAGTLSAELVDQCLRVNASEGLRLITISDSYRQPDIEQSLIDAKFEEIGGVFTKLSIGGVWNHHDLAECLLQATSLGTHASVIGNRISYLLLPSQQGSHTATAELESRLWPLKIQDSILTNYIVPIRPGWAMQLFDTRLSQSDLFGGMATLLFRKENVYYRSARGARPESGSRILWYVSNSRQQSESGSIRAAAFVRDVWVLPARAAFHYGKRYGVYRWEDVLGTAGGNPDGLVMLISFSGIEEFPQPINFEKTNIILDRHGQSKNQFQGPVKISSAAYVDIYKTGIEVA